MVADAATLRLLTTLLVAAFGGSFSFALLVAPTRAPNRLGLRGLKRQRAVARGSWARIEPLVRWLGVRVSGVVSESWRAKLDVQIALAGDILGLTADEYVATMLLGGVGGVGFAFVAASVASLGINLALMIFVPVGAMLPYLQVTGTGQDRLVQLGRGLPFMIDLMAMAMSAGLDFPGAVRQVVDKSPNPDDPCVEEMSLILQGLQIGRTRREVLEELARRAPCEQVLEFTAAVIQAEQRGNPLAEVLQIQASTHRTRRSAGAEEAASKASVKMTLPLLLVFISVLLLVIGPMAVGMANMQ